MSELKQHVSDVILDLQRELWLEGKGPCAAILLPDDLKADLAALLDLVYHEIVIRDELGQSPSLDEYIQTYPELEEELRLHFDVHAALKSELLADTDAGGTADSWPATTTSRPFEGVRQDEYSELTQIGAGGMAVVYKARQRRLRRDVALKVFRLNRRLTDREVARLRTEAEALASLAHPHIIQIFEIGERHGAPFLALELAEGGTLANRLAEKPLLAAAAAELTETLARAVHHAHQRHVIHRDLKPANILFTGEGVPKISDFGLAKILSAPESGTVDITLTGETIGTPRYMAPEQVVGEHADVCFSTDVYALGTVLYECLTGRAPFVSASVSETFHQIRHDEPLAPRRLLASIPRDLETICLHCLEKETSRRYQTALELAEDLSRFRCGDPIGIRPIGALERTWRWSRKRPAQAMLIALFLLLILGLAGGSYAIALREHSRIDGLRQQVAQLMLEGRSALDRDELQLAQSKFQMAWQTVQSEPELFDHETSVAGWLDHARNAINRYHWSQRIPPRDYDDRRDEALLLAIAPGLRLSAPLAAAHEAIESALELTAPGEHVWLLEREQLIWLESLLVERESGADRALQLLDEYPEFASRRIYSRRAELLRTCGNQPAADLTETRAREFPQVSLDRHLQSGIRLLENSAYGPAFDEFERVLLEQPEHFVARLLQSVCAMQLDRLEVAKVALTACAAQRPHFSWVYVLRGRVFAQSDDIDAARADFEAVRSGRPSEAARSAALAELELIELRKKNSVALIPRFTRIVRRIQREAYVTMECAIANYSVSETALAVARATQSMSFEHGRIGSTWAIAALQMLKTLGTSAALAPDPVAASKNNK